MKLFLLSPLALLASGLVAAEIKTPTARINTVTVYADRAEVVRQLRIALEPGEHTLVFDDLPGSTDLSNVRVNGRGAFTLVDIRTESVQLREAANAQVRQLQMALKVQELRLQEITQAETRIAFQKSALDKVLTRLTAAGKESANPEMDPLKWAAYLDFHSKQLADLDLAGVAQQKLREEARLETDRLGRELNELQGGQRRVRNVARVNIDVKEAGEATLDLSYIVHGPSWTPTYDMRANTRDGSLTVAYHAQVRQSTGEDWKAVNLRLSTAQPGIAGREPQLDPWFISRLEIVSTDGVGSRLGNPEGRLRRDVDRLQMFNEMPVAGKVSAAGKPEARDKMSDRGAKVTVGATAATYAVARPSDIPSDNKMAKVAITQETFTSVFRHTCVPKLSPYVYLKTKAVNTSEFTFLPGSTAVFLDGAFVASASIDLVPAGQEFWTYLGVDSSVMVERKELNRRSETSGIFGKKTARTVIDQVFKVKNGKAADIELVLWDQVPITNHEDIRVVIEEPRYEKDSDFLRMNETKFLEWRLLLKGGEKKDVPFRFAVERPEDMDITGL